MTIVERLIAAGFDQTPATKNRWRATLPNDGKDLECHFLWDSQIDARIEVYVEPETRTAVGAWAEVTMRKHVGETLTIQVLKSGYLFDNDFVEDRYNNIGSRIDAYCSETVNMVRTWPFTDFGFDDHGMSETRAKELRAWVDDHCHDDQSARNLKGAVGTPRLPAPEAQADEGGDDDAVPL